MIDRCFGRLFQYVLVLGTLGWTGIAHASGHLPSGLAQIFIFGGLIAFALWVVSWWLLVRKSSLQVWLWGTIIAGLTVPLGLSFSKGMSNEHRNLVLIVAVFPMLMHQLKVVSLYRRRQEKRARDGGLQK